MVVRIWSVRIAPGRIDEFEQFIREHTPAMFREQQGLVASVRARDGDSWRNITLWQDAEPAEGLDSAPAYVSGVKAMEDAGLTVGAPTTEVLQLRGALVPDPDELLRMLGA
jgi:hypothetical protein